MKKLQLVTCTNDVFSTPLFVRCTHSFFETYQIVTLVTLKSKRALKSGFVANVPSILGFRWKTTIYNWHKKAFLQQL